VPFYETPCILVGLVSSTVSYHCLILVLLFLLSSVNHSLAGKSESMMMVGYSTLITVSHCLCCFSQARGNAALC